MIETQFGSERNDLIGPPCDADGMLGVFRCVTGATANDIVVKLIPHREERRWRNSKHCVVKNSPFRSVTGFHWKRTTLKRNGAGWMRLCIVHIHVEALGRGVDPVVELVCPGPDDLLQIVVTEFAVIKRI